MIYVAIILIVLIVTLFSVSVQYNGTTGFSIFTKFFHKAIISIPTAKVQQQLIAPLQPKNCKEFSYGNYHSFFAPYIDGYTYPPDKYMINVEQFCVNRGFGSVEWGKIKQHPCVKITIGTYTGKSKAKYEHGDVCSFTYNLKDITPGYKYNLTYGCGRYNIPYQIPYSGIDPPTYIDLETNPVTCTLNSNVVKVDIPEKITCCGPVGMAPTRAGIPAESSATPVPQETGTAESSGYVNPYGVVTAGS